jgi:hypothetical protein
MTTQTVNFTDRKRITRNDARIRLHQEGDTYTFTAQLQLKPYKLPGSAKVYVEAYYQWRTKRFSYGTVENIQEPTDRSLREFGSIERIKFRVKVVDVEKDFGRILAQADRITPRGLDSQKRKSILPTEWEEDIGEQIWVLHYEDDGPILKINPRFKHQRRAVEHIFAPVVLPQVFRDILYKIYRPGSREDLMEDSSDADDAHWHIRWKKFVYRLMGTDRPESADEAQIEDWIDDVVQKFCRHHKLLDKFDTVLESVSGDAKE